MEERFARKLNLLLALSRSWDTNALFGEMAQELIAELQFDAQTIGIDHVALSGHLGGLAGCLETQKLWLMGQADRVIAQHESTAPAVRWSL